MSRSDDERIERLIEENKGLAGKALAKYMCYFPKNSLNTREDFYAIALAALWTAISSYDESKGSLSSFAYPIIRNHLFMEFNHAGRQKRAGSARSYSPEVINRIHRAEAIDETDKFISETNTVKALKDARDRCDSIKTRKGIEALWLRAQGYSISDIRTQLDVGSNKTISTYMLNAKNKLRSDPEFLRAVF